jgi:hypothetical protein
MLEFFVIHHLQSRQQPSNCFFSCKSGLRHLDHEFASLRAGPFTLCSPKESSELLCGEELIFAKRIWPEKGIRP